MSDRKPISSPGTPRPNWGTRANDAVCNALTRLHLWLAKWLTRGIGWLWERQGRLSLSLRFCIAAAGLAIMAAVVGWYLPHRFAARMDLRRRICAAEVAGNGARR